MRKRRKNTVTLVFISILLVLILLVAFTYGITKFMQLPIDLPFMPQQVLAKSNIDEVQPIIDSWSNVTIYESKIEEVENIIVEEPEPVVEPEPIPLSTRFDNLIELSTLQGYLDTHLDIASNGNEMIFIDELTKNNQATGIKTKMGDDIIALANYEGVMIAGITLDNGCYVKVVFIANDISPELYVVENLSYWEEIDIAASKSQALFAINASDYTWNDVYDCGSLKGLVKRNGDTIRKAKNNSLAVGFNTDNKLVIGNKDNITTGVEGTQILIQDNISQYNLEAETTEEDRKARTAVGELEDGTKIFVVADLTNGGATIADIVRIFNKYNATDAIMLSCDTRTAMWWNGRIAINMPDNDANGVKLPTSWIIKSVYTEAINNVASTKGELSGVEAPGMVATIPSNNIDNNN